MRGLGISVIVTALMVMTSAHVQSQEPPQPVLGYGSETFDWSAEWLASIFGVFTSILVLVLVGGLVIRRARSVFPSWQRTQAPRSIRPLRGGG